MPFELRARVPKTPTAPPRAPPMTAAPASPPSPSGIADVDARWGGLRSGSATLLVGRATEGRSALALAAAQAATDAGQSCLLISPRAPEELAAIARADGLDLAAVYASGRLRVLRIPSAQDLAAKGDDGLRAAYRDLGGIATQADRLVVEDFTPLVQFSTFDAFAQAFTALRAALGTAETAFVLGLGAPANDASRQLLDVVRQHVDGVVLVSTRDGQRVVEIEGAAPPAAAAPATPVPAAPESAHPFAAPAMPSPPPQPFSFPPSDGASVEVEAPQPGSGPTPMAPPAAPAPVAMPEPAPPAAQVAAPSPQLAPAADPFGAETPLPGATPAPPLGGLARATVSPADPPDPDLMQTENDPYGRDPADALMAQGFLVDSASGAPVPATAVHQAAYPEVFAPEPAAAPAPYAPPAPTPPAPAFPAPTGAPAFTALDSAPAPPATTPQSFQSALAQSFAARDQQATPFVVVATRMAPTAPESAHFATVVAGLRAGLPDSGMLYADEGRLRAVALLPSAGPDSAQGLFGSLQSHLRQHVGAQAESVLAAVAAITVPDGRPFATAPELWSYAIDS